MKSTDEVVEDYMTTVKNNMESLVSVFDGYMDEQEAGVSPEERKRLMTTFMLGFQIAVNELIDLREEGKPWGVWAEVRLDEVVDFVKTTLGREIDDETDLWRLPSI